MEDVVSKPKIQEAVSSVGQQLSTAIDNASKGDFQALVVIAQSYLWPAIMTLGLVIFAYFVAKFASRIASAPVCKRVDETLGKFVGKLVFNAIIVGTLLGVLGKFGVDVTSFAAVLGAMGFAIGLAFQGTLSNFSAGILLLVFRPFKVGDVVVAGAVSGRVNEIDLFTTTMDTPDNRRIIVPNSAISGSTIENVTFHAHRRVEITVGVAYNCSVDETRAALIAAAESLRIHLVDGNDRGYQVGLSNLGPSSVDWQVRFWTRSPDFGAVKESLLIAVKQQLDERGLSIPFPQLDVHLLDSRALEARGDVSPTKNRIRPERVA